jgi:hypothetical protein
MAEEVSVPGTGKVPKNAVVAVGGIAGAYIAYRWWRNRQASAAASAATAVTPIDTSNTAAGQFGESAYTNPGGIPNQTTTSSGMTTDAQWTAAVESDLTAIGYDGQAVAVAIGQYLASQPLDTNQQGIIRVAWGFEGKPPEHPGLAIIPLQTPPGGGSTTPPPSGGGTTTPPPPPPPDPHAGQHWQNPQVATLVDGWSLVKYNQEHYNGSASTLATLERLNPGLNPNDVHHGGRILIRTSDGRWVNN